MKKLLILLCALALTGCAAKEGSGKTSASPNDLVEYPEEVVVTQRTSPSDLAMNDPWGIALTAQEVTNKGCTIVCTQVGGKDIVELTTGAPFFLEMKVGEEWTTYPPQHENVAWTADAWLIVEGSRVAWNTDWSWLYGELPAGEYRVGKEIMNVRAAGDYDTATYYAEFTVK